MGQSFQPSRFAVLVVEHDPLILTEAVDLVEEAGFIAYEARNADQAIRLLERHPEITVLLTDVDMPGSMDGLKLARAVRDRWPPVRIIVTSGHTKVTEADMPEESLFFAKPYPPQTMVQALTRVAEQLLR
ncbi:response regulator [Mangrovibrevibacter kandeliae]|uniref:response regulator n=1 Tax=Mangrovibrevibacter kandeliae TaxID=2968473 RepID=UPI0021192FE1|nr:response regulator [Aurantimonas sp. CSK15Z-1]MCQ8782057.1 response regulator [Aurantimonas sp. CSK15Z-1]